MDVDEGAQLLGRSNSAFAKNALARRRISLVRRSSLLSRSSALIRFFSEQVEPSRRPLSRSYWRTQLNTVAACQPNFWATEITSCHWDLCCASCSDVGVDSIPGAF